jgi:hypothetical protein
VNVDKRELVIIAASTAMFLTLDTVNIVSLIYVAVISWGIRKRTLLILINIEEVVSLTFRGPAWFSMAGALHVPLVATIAGYYALGFLAVWFYRLILRFTPIPRVVGDAFGYGRASGSVAT